MSKMWLLGIIHGKRVANKCSPKGHRRIKDKKGYAVPLVNILTARLKRANNLELGIVYKHNAVVGFP